MMKSAASAGIDVGRILEIAEAIAPNVSVFEAPLGIDEGCLSAEKLVNLLHRGVRGKDATHLMACSTCAENVRNLRTVLLNSDRDFVGNALKKTVSKEGSPFKEGFFPVILAIPEKMISVGADEEQGSLAFTCGLFPLAASLDEIDLSSLQASGAIVCKSAPKVEFVDLDDDGSADFIKLTFPEGHLAPRVQEAMKGRQNVVDTVQVDGDIFAQEKKRRLVGQARIEFASAADQVLR